MRSTPSSVSFWATHSGRAPLVGTNPTVITGSAPGWLTTSPSTTRVRSADPESRHRTQEPAPSDAMTTSSGRSRKTSDTWWAVASSSPGERRSATKTMAEADASSGSGAPGTTVS